MLQTYFQGLLLGAAMILPLGPQNVFVLQQGCRKQYHLMSAFLCTISDVLLIAAGVFGGSVLLSQSVWLMALVTWGGVAFLVWYGFGALRSVFTNDVALTIQEQAVRSRWRVIMTLVAVTWLNPHVYLDTFVVLGSIGGQLGADLRIWFTAGAVCASVLWFFGLALLSAWFSPVLQRPVSQRIINLFVGSVMWYIAIQLASSYFRMPGC